MAARAQLASPLPGRLGPLRFSACHLPPAAPVGCGPGPGGDVYGAVLSAYGVRLLMADVMGKGPEPARTAAAVLRAWRALAQLEPGLEGIALRLHSLIARSDHPDRFVTATLLSVADDGAAELICCGHPPPLLLRGRSAVQATMPAPAPPLGLLDLNSGWCTAQPLLRPGWDRLLLYTDGVSEARDAGGAYYPLADRAGALRHLPLEGFTSAMAAELVCHAGGRLHDDASLLAVQAGTGS